MKNGVLASYRDKFKLLKDKFLKDEEFILYDYCVHLADFDEKHDNFGTFERDTNEVLGSGLGWSGDKLRRNFNALLNKGALRLMGNRLVEVVGFTIYLPKQAFALKKSNDYLSGLFAEVSSENAIMQTSNANLRKTDRILATKTVAISDISSYKVATINRRGREEYESIVRELGFTHTDTTDLEWIDNHVISKNIRA